jgi:hypothetical protein
MASYSQIEKEEKSGIYQMKCLDCPLKYIDQTGRTSHIYKEHQISNHILNTGSTYGTITDTMDVIK